MAGKRGAKKAPVREKLPDELLEDEDRLHPDSSESLDAAADHDDDSDGVEAVMDLEDDDDGDDADEYDSDEDLEAGGKLAKSARPLAAHLAVQRWQRSI